jgi:hypothetical protein
VLADGVVVGRIMKAAAAPVDAPWLWTLEDRTPTYGYEATREAAMAAYVTVRQPCRENHGGKG